MASKASATLTQFIAKVSSKESRGVFLVPGLLPNPVCEPSDPQVKVSGFLQFENLRFSQDESHYLEYKPVRAVSGTNHTNSLVFETS